MKPMKLSSKGRNNSLKFRFFAYFMASGLLLILLMAALSYWTVHRYAMENFRQQTIESGMNLEQRMKGHIEREKKLLEALHQSLEPSQVVASLKETDRYHDSLILSPGGVVMNASDPWLTGYRYENKGYFQQALENQEKSQLLVQYDPFEQQAFLHFIVPVLDKQGALTHIGVHRMLPIWLESQIGREHLKGSGEFLVTDQQGIVLFKVCCHALGEEEVAAIKPASVFDHGLTYKDMKNLGEEPVHYVGDGFMVTYQNLEGSWGIVSGKTSTQAIDRQLSLIFRGILITLLLATFIFAAFGILLANRTMKPIRDLTNQVQATLTGRQPQIFFPANSELSQLVEGFNHSWKENRLAQEKLLEEKQEAEKLRIEAEQANLAKTQFMANVSHELRTPLNGILGMIQLTMNRGQDSQSQENLKKAQQFSHHLLKIITDLLDFARLETDTLGIREEVFLLEPMFRKLAESYGGEAEKKKVDFFIHGTQELPTALLGDGQRIEEVLNKLLDNAFKFTQQGSITVDFSLKKEKSGQENLLISVADTGIGIPEDKKMAIFDGFTQADGSTQRAYEGLGVGLSMVQKLVDAMGGMIWMESKEKVGSSFYVSLPVAVVETPWHHELAEEPYKQEPAHPLELKKTKERPIHGEVVKQLESLKEKIKAWDFIDEEDLGHIREALAGQKQGMESFRDLEEAISGFDYEKALEILETILRQ